METKKIKIIEFLLECEAIKFGQFTLKSGIQSPFFIDLGRVDSGKRFEFFATCLAETLKEKFPDVTLLFGPAYKGISLATAVSMRFWQLYGLDLGVFFDRKEVKDHGEGGKFIGRLPKSSDVIVLLDDVISDGATKIQACKQLELSFGVKAKGVFVCVDRSPKDVTHPVVVESMVSLLDLINFLEIRKDEKALVLRKFWENRDAKVV